MTARLRCPARQNLIHLWRVASYTTPVFDHQGVVLLFQIRVIRVGPERHAGAERGPSGYQLRVLQGGQPFCRIPLSGGVPPSYITSYTVHDWPSPSNIRAVSQSVPSRSQKRNGYDNIMSMPAHTRASTVNNSGSPATHFGRQMKKERLARGWTLRQLAAKTGVNFSHLGRIENGHRPPTESVALACDRVFPERRGWFAEYYQESRTWMPPGFRDWPEYENKATRLSEWSPGIITGLLQSQDYARALLAVHPGVTSEVVAARLANRMQRQRRVLFRDDPPTAAYLIDHAALYRLVGSAEVMAGQMAHLADVASMPNITLQILPAVAHPATQSGFMVADDAGYVEHVLGGLVYTELETVTSLARLFDTLRAESYRASESAAIIGKAQELWTGERAATAAATAATA